MMHYTEYVVNMQNSLPEQPHTLIPDAVRRHKKEATLPKPKSLYHKRYKSRKLVLTQIVEMICTLKYSMWQELEEFGLLPMNRADYRHSWTYSFAHEYLTIWRVLRFKQLLWLNKKSHKFKIAIER